ncbi:DUF418 domain-containing protein [Labilibacter sediminis]|nr:DUF418 domain-containing protein [Labilibacter sediminis]
MIKEGSLPPDTKRLHVVDALRGFAIVSIMLLHNIEHFDVYHVPQNLPSWMTVVDKMIWESLFFLFSGKSYGMFAVLFGLTFFIQSNNQTKKGKSFNGRFAWRMFLLFGFGILNSVFFQGDILTIYAVLGLFLIPFRYMGNRVMLFTASILLLLPVEICHLIQGIIDSDMIMSNPESWTYFGKMSEYITGDSFLETAWGNLTNGKTAVLLWNKENGRFFLILSYFLFGLLTGRKHLFNESNQSKYFWKRALVIAAIAFIPLFIVKLNLGQWVDSKAILRPLRIMISTWSNAAFMVFLIAGFYLLFYLTGLRKILNYFSAFGKMSLSNYIIQSVLGGFIYYGFGLGLYQYTGSTYAVLIGLVLTVLLGLFCNWWGKRFKHGPFEAIWHYLTWIKIK